MLNQTPQDDLLVSLKAGMAIQARDDVLHTFVLFAADYIEQGLTQEGADVLAFVLRCEALPDDIEEQALDLWEDLERWICPRVLLDAEDFGKKAYLEDVVDYIVAGA
ncbi:MAG: hypothetical protein WBC91_09645 [Phototrophicaceae bacterium]